MGHGLEQAMQYFIMRAVVHSNEGSRGIHKHQWKEGFACIGYHKYVFTITNDGHKTCMSDVEGKLYLHQINYGNSSRAVHHSENIIPELLAGLVSG